MATISTSKNNYLDLMAAAPGLTYNTPLPKNPPKSTGLVGVQGTPVAVPKTTSNPLKIPSTSSATTTQKTTITPPTQASTLSPAGSTYVNSVLGTSTTAPYESTTSTTGSTATKTTPQTTARDEFINAYKAYQDAQKATQDVTAAKQAYNDFVANQTKSVAAKEGQGRGIPLDIVRGQQRLLKEQTDPEALRLQNEIGIAQDAYNASVAGAKGGVDAYSTLLGLDQKNTPTPPASVQEYEYAVKNGYTGSFSQYQTEDANRKAAALGQGSFTLGKDDIRYDANGNPIAKGSSAGAAGLSSSAQSALSVIDQLLASNTGAITGLIQSPAALIPGTAAQRTKNLYKQLQGMLSLENRQQLKGSGAISDFEFRVLSEAASALGRNLSDADFVAELQKIRSQLAAGDTSAGSAASSGGGYNPGSSIYSF